MINWIIWFLGLFIVAPLEVITLMRFNLTTRWSYYCEYELEE